MANLGALDRYMDIKDAPNRGRQARSTWPTGPGAQAGRSGNRPRDGGR